MVSTVFSRASKVFQVPAGVAAASTASIIVGEWSYTNTYRRFSVNASTSAAETLLQNAGGKSPVKPVSVGAKAIGTSKKTAGRNSFVKWYESHLEISPVKTKMVTGGILWVSQNCID